MRTPEDGPGPMDFLSDILSDVPCICDSSCIPGEKDPLSVVHLQVSSYSPISLCLSFS